MKELLAAIKAKLQADLTYIRDRDIFITPHENYIPHHVRPPCVGIKDGDIDGSDGMSECEEARMVVTVIPYVQLAKDEAAIMGDPSAGRKGILDIDADIKASLDNNLLDIEGMQGASCKSSKASELFGDEQETLQRKLIRCEYEKQE